MPPDSDQQPTHRGSSGVAGWVRSWTQADAAGPASVVRARRLRLGVAVLLFLGVCGFLIDGANRPANPYLLPTPHRTGAPTPFKG